MNPSDVRDSYNAIAHRWHCDEFSKTDGIIQHERAITFAGSRGVALDIGCGGSGRIIDLLLKNGFSVEGLDISEKMLELARSRHPHVEFHEADICQWEFKRKYDFISAWDSIWHVPLQNQEQLLLKIFNGLNHGGVAIFSIGGTENPSDITNSYMGPPMYHSTLGITRTLELIGKAGAICRHLEYDQCPQLHVYIICQKVSLNDK